MNERHWEPDPSKHLETLKDWISCEVMEAIKVAIEEEGRIYLSSTDKGVSITFASIDKPVEEGQPSDIFNIDMLLYDAAMIFASDYGKYNNEHENIKKDMLNRLRTFENIAKALRDKWGIPDDIS